MAQFRYLGRTIRHENLIQEEMISDNAYYHSVQNFLSSRVLLKDVKVGIYKTTILHVVLYGYET
jgi:hypothetical protein